MIYKVLMRSLFLLLMFFAFQLPAAVVSQRIFQQDSDFKFSEDMLSLVVQTRKGAPFSEQIMNDDVKRLAGRGMFADVSASSKLMPDGTVQVTFRLLAKPVVEEVIFEGNEKIKTKDLKEKVRFTLFAPCNDDKIIETANAIRELYKKDGREGTKVTPIIKTRPGGTVTITFKIEEELRVRIHDVFFEGNKVYSASEMKENMETRYSPLSVSWLSWLPLEGKIGLYDLKAIERDKIRLRELYYRKGYLDFKVKSVKASPVEGNIEKVDLLFTVEEGEPYFIGNIRVTGVTAFPQDDIFKCIRQVHDNVFNVQTEDQDIQRIEAFYAPEGYADLNVKVNRNANFMDHTVDLEYHVSEGPQYTIGEIKLTGNKWTKPNVILRELPLNPGDKLDRRKLDIAKSRLLGMNYFQGGKNTESKSGVDINAVNSAEPGKKDILINVNEKKFIDGHIGAGWSDSDGLAGMLELNVTNLDILDPKNYFLGGGQRMRLYGLIGTERRNAVFEFTEPWLFGIPLRWHTSIYLRDYLYEDWKESRLGVTTSLMKRFFDDFTSAELGYTFEHVQVYDMDDKMTKIFQDQTGGSFVGRLSLDLKRDTRDSYTDPRSGYVADLFGSISTRALGGSYDYYKVELKGVNYYPFFHNWFVFMLGAKLGMMGGFAGTSNVPLYDRYFLGGGDSIRGFPYRSIGPEDSREKNYGGEFMYLVTAELSHPIYKDYLRGGFFCDFGGASESIFRFDQPNMGIGYGLRIKLPGFPMPIRLDLAYPILNKQEGVANQLRFHFNLGFAL